ncbi:hypothetical protein SSX86_027282 [Deinandra increscens subsp. villosa]|uniref:LIM zinc-binding domain-containing protein n=1 Tax=Deinandra increscens subsp. villosa TaxID=3103831 RepID=A0AAP0CJS0_9ASTR
MSFTGTLDKCKACDKTVYFLDLLTVDGVTYHKTCFRCSHCKGTLVMSNYSSMDGVLYCRTHFEQLFKESGNFSKNFQTGYSRINLNIAEYETLFRKARQRYFGGMTPNKLSSMFSGTTDKCRACNKTVYPLEKVTMEGEPYHKCCFKCAHGGCPLTHSSYAALDGVLYCRHHFAQLFMEKGTYSHVLEAANQKKNAPASSEEQSEQQAPGDEGEAVDDNQPEPSASSPPPPDDEQPAEEKEEEKEEDEQSKTD